MKFQFSDLIEPSIYETQGLCDGIPLRKHRESFKEDLGALRAQNDWAKRMGPLNHYRGGLGPEYSFLQIVMPECLPERLEILAYANEFAFLYDDCMEKINQDGKGAGLNHPTVEVFGDNSEKEGVQFNKVIEEKKLRTQIFAEMAAIDPERALTSMNAWETYVHLTTSRSRSIPFATLEEYLPYRMIDAGEMLWFGILTFGMALTIPTYEIDLCLHLARPAFAAFALTNDLFSWEKERADAQEKNLPCMINAIWVLMHERSIAELEAKSICRDRIKSYVAESVRLCEETQRNHELSEETRTYVEAAQLSVSGNLVWTLNCPRYHREIGFSEGQMERMREFGLI